MKKYMGTFASPCDSYEHRLQEVDFIAVEAKNEEDARRKIREKAFERIELRRIVLTNAGSSVS
jgi:hypothetical protein